MSSMRFVLATTVALLCLLLVPSALADVCIGQPSSIAIGGKCAGLGFCRKGSYCNYLGVCTALVKVGGNCSSPGDTCVPGANCLGPTGAKICVQNVGLGSACSTNSSNTAPMCDSSYVCNPITQLCASGYPGDTCQTAGDCITNCTNGVCSFFAIGATCLSSAQCAVGSYCPGFVFPSVCTALLAAGANCTSSQSCSYGNYCIQTSPTSTQQMCVAQGTLAAGSYCGGIDAVCKNNLCYDNYCVSNPPQYCGSNGGQFAECGNNMICQCDGNLLVYGYGYCTSASCVSQSNNFAQCVSSNCQRSNVGVGTCANSSCLSQYNSLNSCSSASSLFASFSLIAFVAILASFFSKEF